ncbi:O-antigen ligase family protein [Marivirga salinae]|uniref:O-antigen ligase family protein n=1 Tax=Marivirga salinarum TaxID=3059078 RepID=A0AA51RD12_9BACT|nr:O-antigen ligase family protein [Marivirga sp. BDSF4-3]WMN12468.1 O-antigen ligase family protein [Marivirga sp. BDSF4-3]
MTVIHNHFIEFSKKYKGKKFDLGILFSIGIILFTMPLVSHKVTSAASIFAAILFIIKALRNSLTIKQFLKKDYYPIVAYFLLMIVGLTYSSNVELGLFNLEKSASLILFPLLFSSIHLNNKTRNILINTFILGVFTGAFICNVNQILLYSNPFHNFYILLLEPLAMHPTYFSLYLNMSIAMLLLKIFDKISPLQIVIYAVLIIYAIIFGFYVGSKIFIVGLLITFIAILILQLGFNYKSISLIIISISVIIIVSYNVDFFQRRFYIPLFKVFKGNYYTFFFERTISWYCSLVKISESPVIGYGTGSVQEALTDCYLENGKTFYHNAHNQYLSTLLGYGIPGLLILLNIYLKPMFLYLKKILNKPLILFSIIIAIYSLTEVLLGLNKGILFISLFYCLLMTFKKDIKCAE